MELQINILNDKPSLFYYEDNIFSNNELDFLTRLNYKDGEYGNLKISRKQLWFQNDNKYFCPIWKKRINRWESEPYFDELTLLQNKVQNYIEELENKKSLFQNNGLDKLNINSCLINYYETGNNFIPPHKDSSLSFGEYPTIVCVSYGDERTMILKNKEEDFSFRLKSNSIFIMAGSSQKYYTHEIERKESENPRYSLTFRNYIL